jgi:hypothetical protein
MLPPTPPTPSHVSVNRVRIVDLPGLPVDDEVRGHRADHLLSSRALMRYARERAEALQLPAAYARDTIQTRLELPCLVNACLSSPYEPARAAAQAIGRRLGRNLGHVLLTLHRGDAANRAARPDWTAQESVFHPLTRAGCARCLTSYAWIERDVRFETTVWLPEALLETTAPHRPSAFAVDWTRVAAAAFPAGYH